MSEAENRSQLQKITNVLEELVENNRIVINLLKLIAHDLQNSRKYQGGQERTLD
jgi:hypothetical protein